MKVKDLKNLIRFLPDEMEILLKTDDIEFLFLNEGYISNIIDFLEAEEAYHTIRECMNDQGWEEKKKELQILILKN